MDVFPYDSMLLPLQLISYNSLVSYFSGCVNLGPLTIKWYCNTSQIEKKSCNSMLLCPHLWPLCYFSQVSLYMLWIPICIFIYSCNYYFQWSPFFLFLSINLSAFIPFRLNSILYFFFFFSADVSVILSSTFVYLRTFFRHLFFLVKNSMFIGFLFYFVFIFVFSQ